MLEVTDQAARIGFQPAREPGGALVKEREYGTIALDGVRWAKPASGPQRGRVPTRISQVLEVGDVIYVDPIAGKDGQFRLRQVPEVSGGIVALDPQTGRVLAMVGGFSFDQSQFNRATQALRQPGSSFKPLVYAAALDNGYTPSTVVLDAPIEIDTGSGVWRPENYEGKFYGPSTLRFGIERSRNVMTVRLAQDLGMPLIGEYAKRFGIYDNPPPYISFVLGAGETTLLSMTAAYAMFDNGGRKITPTLIDRIQDRYGRTIYRHDQRECRGCSAEGWTEQPARADAGRPARARARPMTAYQITSMMEGVVQRGTATVVREVGKPIAGKTGTTNDEKDAWFIGFSPEMVVGVYLGYDKPRHLGRGGTGGQLAAPIVRDFLKVALADRPAVPFRVPAGIKLIRVNPRTGMRAGPGERVDPRSLQARHRAARRLFRDRRHRSDGRPVAPRRHRRRQRPLAVRSVRAATGRTAPRRRARISVSLPARLCESRAPVCDLTGGDCAAAQSRMPPHQDCTPGLAVRQSP